MKAAVIVFPGSNCDTDCFPPVLKRKNKTRGSGRMRKLFFILSLFLFATVVPHTVALGSPPRDHAELFLDGKYILVVLRRRSFFKEDEELRRRYPVSGLYEHENAKLVWEFEQVSALRGAAVAFFLSSDIRHLLVVQTLAWFERSSSQMQLVFFFEDGRLIKSYRVKELISDESALRSGVINMDGGFSWLRTGSFPPIDAQEEDFSFDEETQQLRLTTVEGKKFIFNVTNGEMTRL